jgi:hypothetical protein
MSKACQANALCHGIDRMQTRSFILRRSMIGKIEPERRRPRRLTA